MLAFVVYTSLLMMNVSGMKNTLAGRDKEVLVKVMGENKQHLPIFVKAGHKLGGCFLPYRFLLVLRYDGGVFFFVSST